VDPRLVFPVLRARSLDTVLLEMAENLGAAGVVRQPQELAQRLRQRERDGCTGLGAGIAFPHCRVEGLPDVVLAVGVSEEGIDFGAADGIPIRLLFLLLSPKEAPARHLQALARLTRLVRTPGLVEQLEQAHSADGIARALQEAEAATSAATTA
jgi:mannitol/fructose-specific phosphotransferase system IIA component (Ntr-type)